MITAALPPPQKVAGEVTRALQEDIGCGDCTATLIATETQLQTRVISREAAIIAGQAWFDEVFRQLDPKVLIDWRVQDGASVSADEEVCRLNGAARAILTGERTALNFLQTLSGTATQTHRYVEAVAGTGTRILDTRKTLPGLRLAQKYAVLCGGGLNHRIGLFDAILIKENHISAAGSIRAAVKTAQVEYPGLLLEVEVEDLEQLSQAHAAGVRRVLLDNFSLEKLRDAVARFGVHMDLEASGGINLSTVGAIAETGVDYISTGDITKNLKSVDFSMRFV
jgi:nicotinate-nucleotide pyrophosphorylase (carboxylating)